jgi:hypothetical protein
LNSPTTALRILLALRGESLDSLGCRIGYRKGTLSTASRFPDTAGPKLRKALSKYLDLPWHILSAPCTRETIASAFIEALTKETK